MQFAIFPQLNILVIPASALHLHGPDPVGVNWITLHFDPGWFLWQQLLSELKIKQMSFFKYVFSVHQMQVFRTHSCKSQLAEWQIKSSLNKYLFHATLQIKRNIPFEMMKNNWVSLTRFKQQPQFSLWPAQQGQGIKLLKINATKKATLSVCLVLFPRLSPSSLVSFYNSCYQKMFPT